MKSADNTVRDKKEGKANLWLFTTASPRPKIMQRLFRRGRYRQNLHSTVQGGYFCVSSPVADCWKSHTLSLSPVRGQISSLCSVSSSSYSHTYTHTRIHTHTNTHTQTNTLTLTHTHSLCRSHSLSSACTGRGASCPLRCQRAVAMLPWRRSKFVLVKDEEKSKPKSLGAGLTYHSLLSSLLHSCPDLRPDCPFHWLGSVFQNKRQKVELNREEPAYSVRYLGSAVTILAKGEGCVQEAVAKIWQHSNYGEQSLKLKLSVGAHGIRMGADASGRKKPSHLFSLNRITYCSAEAHRPKIFAWIYRHQVKNKAVVLRCHAVLLAKAEKARALALSLLHNASSSFSEFKRLKRQNDFRHCRQELLGEGMVPVAPRRRLLNGQCHYQPPADKPGSATQLCSITEEDEEEEDEEEKEEKENEEEEQKGEKRRREQEVKEGGRDLEKEKERERARRVMDRGPAQLSERDVGKIVSGLGECTISCSEDGQITISTLL